MDSIFTMYHKALLDQFLEGTKEPMRAFTVVCYAYAALAMVLTIATIVNML